MDFQVLDVRFVVVGDSGPLGYVERFTGAYGPPTVIPPTSMEVEVRLRRDVVAPVVGDDVRVHASVSQAEWDFGGVRRHDGDGVTTTWWPTRSTTVRVDVADRSVVVSVDRGVDDPAAGEALFHACRNLALYLRDPDVGHLVHASAVAGPAGAVAFCGLPSAGKTTLFLRAVLDRVLRPLANDRLLLTPGAGPPIAVSFPGYVSCCEGTLMADERLARAALEFEHPDNPARTMARAEPLRYDFTKRYKRLYPMSWLCDIAGTPYVQAAPLRALVLPRVAPDATPELRRLDLATDADRATLLEVLGPNVFADRDPGFLPWHGLAWPADRGIPERVADIVESADVPIFSLRTDPRSCAGLDEILALVSAPPSIPFQEVSA